MESSIRKAIQKSLDELDDVQEKIEDFIDSVPDDTEELKSSAKRVFGQINHLLSRSIEQAGDSAEEAQLQAHLGLMEAKEKLDASKEVLDDLMVQAAEQSKTLMGKAEVQQRLALMEARDFWQERGDKLTDEFKASAVVMKDLSEKAANDMQTIVNQWQAFFKSGK